MTLGRFTFKITILATIQAEHSSPYLNLDPRPRYRFPPRAVTSSSYYQQSESFVQARVYRFGQTPRAIRDKFCGVGCAGTPPHKLTTSTSLMNVLSTFTGDAQNVGHARRSPTNMKNTMRASSGHRNSRIVAPHRPFHSLHADEAALQAYAAHHDRPLQIYAALGCGEVAVSSCSRLLPPTSCFPFLPSSFSVHHCSFFVPPPSFLLPPLSQPAAAHGPKGHAGEKHMVRP